MLEEAQADRKACKPLATCPWHVILSSTLPQTLMFPHPSLRSANLQTWNPIDAVIADPILLSCTVYEPTKLSFSWHLNCITKLRTGTWDYIESPKWWTYVTQRETFERPNGVRPSAVSMDVACRGVCRHALHMHPVSLDLRHNTA